MRGFRRGDETKGTGRGGIRVNSPDDRERLGRDKNKGTEIGNYQLARGEKGRPSRNSVMYETLNRKKSN